MSGANGCLHLFFESPQFDFISAKAIYLLSTSLSRYLSTYLGSEVGTCIYKVLVLIK